MAKLIYVADDEKNIRFLIRTFLENEGYEVKLFSDGYSVRKAISNRMPDLVILDIVMPGEDGLSICSDIRKTSGVPIIIVSAKDSPLDRIAGITLGSDDYITKPFLPLELTARVNALFRRIELTSTQTQRVLIHKCGNMILDLPSRKVTVENKIFPITPTEFDFLLYLVERKEMAITKKELMEKVWDHQMTDIDSRITDDLVKRLRKKLKAQNVAITIETIWGYGYRLTENKIVSND